MFQEMVHAKDPPSFYLNKLRTYLDPKASRSHRVSFYSHPPRSNQRVVTLRANYEPPSIKLFTELLHDQTCHKVHLITRCRDCVHHTPVKFKMSLVMQLLIHARVSLMQQHIIQCCKKANKKNVFNCIATSNRSS
jgi:hypothetical protein